MIKSEDIVRRLDVRPGYSVINYSEVGLPVFNLSALLTLQEKSDIGPIEEFVMKCLSLGINNEKNIIEFLGLPSSIICKQMGSLVYDNSIKRSSTTSGLYELTKKGIDKLHVAKSVSILQEKIPIYVDGITRNVMSISSSSLYNASELEDIGITAILPTPRRPPRAAEVRVLDINRMFNAVSGELETKKTALRLDALVGRSRLYFRKAIVLAYKSENSRKIAISFAIDGRLSDEHEIAFSRARDIKQSKMFAPLFDANKRRREVQAVIRHVREKTPTVIDSLDGMSSDVRKTLTIKKKKTTSSMLQPLLVKQLHVYEHAPLLEKAFDEASERILIISPWIRANVVDKAFINKLTIALDRGVDVKIFYGIGRVDKNERDKDKSARLLLEGMSKSFDNFLFVRKGNTHAKVLLVDSRFFVTTSFNWLSFRGSSDQPFREEWGTYVEGDAIVNNYYNELNINDIE